MFTLDPDRRGRLITGGGGTAVLRGRGGRNRPAFCEPHRNRKRGTKPPPTPQEGEKVLLRRRCHSGSEKGREDPSSRSRSWKGGQSGRPEGIWEIGKIWSHYRKKTHNTTEGGGKGCLSSLRKRGEKKIESANSTFQQVISKDGRKSP